MWSQSATPRGTPLILPFSSKNNVFLCNIKSNCNQAVRKKNKSKHSQKKTYDFAWTDVRLTKIGYPSIWPRTEMHNTPVRYKNAKLHQPLDGLTNQLTDIAGQSVACTRLKTRPTPISRVRDLHNYLIIL